MNVLTPSSDAKFIVEVQNVKEVTLAAEADLAYWQERLKRTGLFPFNQQGKAQLLMSATELRFMGVRTNELTISLVVCERQAADTPDALFLLHAFNSSPLFAWIERSFFSTPYDSGRIRLDDHVPATIQLEDRAGPMLRIQMAAHATLAASRDELWQGKIFLPHRQAGFDKPGKYFVAKLGGRTEIYPYSRSADALDVVSRKAHPVFQWLLESNISGVAWRIRSNATHARSKSFQRA